MSEVELAGQLARDAMNATKEVIQEVRKEFSNLTAETTGRRLEGEAKGEQRDLEAPEQPATATDWYDPGDTQGLPVEAQSDGAWPFGRPDLPSTAG